MWKGIAIAHAVGQVPESTALDNGLGAVRSNVQKKGGLYRVMVDMQLSFAIVSID